MVDRRAPLVLVLPLASACAEDDLSGSLAAGECGPGGRCATGYTCNASNECVPTRDGAEEHDTDPPDAEVDSPCGTCFPGHLCCDGVCVDPQNDPMHCGACATVCPGTLCQAGSCTNECQPGRANCNGNVIDGCEAPASSCPPDASSG